MTFTEAAIHVLRQAGKPLHYKEITEIAITENLLSHVGKTPEITMSSRLTTLTKREGDKGVIEKVKPGVFAIREGVELPDLSDVEVEAEEGQSEEARQLPPGADLFDREEDDDDLIFADLDEDKSKRKKRKRKKRGDDDGASNTEKTERSQRSERSPRSDRSERKEASSSKSGGRDSSANRARNDQNRSQKTSSQPSGDWSREKDDGELAGGGLADEMYEAIASNGNSMSYEQIAAALFSSGRMAGDTRALVPTVAAALRSDNCRREAHQRRPRFSVRAGEARLTQWAHQRESERSLRDALRSAERQRDAVRREFVSILDKLSLVGFVELLASWLNAESVSGLRAVAPPSAQQGSLNLAGNWNRGPLQTRIAVVAFRGVEISPQAVVAARGALHHYADATEVWMITTGKVSPEAREEASAAGAPVALLDGLALARAFERQSIGITSHVTTTLSFDFALLEDLGATVFEPQPRQAKSEPEEGRGKRRRRGRRRGRDRDRDKDSDSEGEKQTTSAQSSESSESSDDREANDESSEASPKKRSRRSRRKRKSDTDDGAKAKSDSSDDGAKAKSDSKSDKGSDDGAKAKSDSKSDKGSDDGDKAKSDSKSDKGSDDGAKAKSDSKSDKGSDGVTTRRRRKKTNPDPPTENQDAG